MEATLNRFAEGKMSLRPLITHHVSYRHIVRGQSCIVYIWIKAHHSLA